MNALQDHIVKLIQENGPISIAHYMELCLTHPELGYYTGKDPLGRAGDFITAPETSQMFGELIGLFMADYWLGLGSPKPFHFIEMGPGRGTLMADALRAIKIIPGMLESIHVHFLEVSPALMAKQKKAVPTATWHETLDDIPYGCSFIIANEFFDCLPVRQFIMTDSGWAERMVGLENKNLAFTFSEKNQPSNLPMTAEIGNILEVCPQAGYWIDAIASKLMIGGGMALIIDYGYDKSGFGDTLQAVHKHKYADVLENPGEIDLTAHVNFTDLKTRAQIAELDVFGPVSQGEFLQTIGLEHRAGQLLKGASKPQDKEILAAVKRLVDEAEMGTLFKVLAMVKKDYPPPAGMT
ncbi:MAG: class I SAM-dependent methyltransferase [Alphaproteobacteria bacterium]